MTGNKVGIGYVGAGRAEKPTGMVWTPAKPHLGCVSLALSLSFWVNLQTSPELPSPAQDSMVGSMLKRAMFSNSKPALETS